MSSIFDQKIKAEVKIWQSHIVVALVRHKEKVPPTKKNGKKEAKIGYARVFARKTHQFFWVIHLHPSIFGSSISTPLSKKIKKSKNIYIFWKVKSPPKKFSHTPPLGGVFDTLPYFHYLAMIVQLLPVVCDDLIKPLPGLDGHS